MVLARNVIENIAINYSTMYRCHELRDELLYVVAERNGEHFYILKKLVEHFGRLVEEKSGWFKGELGADTHWTLFNKINKELLIKVLEKNGVRQTVNYVFYFYVIDNKKKIYVL